MIEVGEITSSAPLDFENELQRRIYSSLAELGIQFERVENSPARTMDDAGEINRRLGGHMAKNILLTNRQRTRHWLLVMQADKPFVTRDFSRALGIPRVSFAPEEELQEILGVERGAANILCTLLGQREGREYTLVVDREVMSEPVFMLPDASVRSHLKLATDDLFGKLLPTTGFDPVIVDLP